MRYSRNCHQNCTKLKDVEQAELLNAFLSSVFTDKTRAQESLTQETRVNKCQEKDLPLVIKGLENLL